MANAFQLEHTNLRWSWDRYPCEHLDTYLVADIEDPRINCQSILTRSLIADSLWPNTFTDLIDAEFRFGTVLNWILNQLKSGIKRYNLLESIANDQGQACPNVVFETYHWLQSEACPITDYISSALGRCNPDTPEQRLCERALNTFSHIWSRTLQGCSSKSIHVLEPACGSANDYRFIERCGLSKYVTYTGIDISTKNIANAKRRYSNTDFRVASILESGFEDDSFDTLFVHDLFEHLSANALDKALAEVLRVCRSQAWLHFFNVTRCNDHVIRPIEQYHWNTLSIEKLCRRLSELGGQIEILWIPHFLKNKFGDNAYHNPNACTLLVTK